MRVPDSDLTYDGDGVWRLAGKPFTGVSYEEHDGRLVCEMSFQDGMETGPTREWYPSGQLRIEQNLRGGAGHGWYREWHDNGQLKREAFYENAILILDSEWDAAGSQTTRFTIGPTDPWWPSIAKYRQLYGNYGLSDAPEILSRLPAPT